MRHQGPGGKGQSVPRTGQPGIGASQSPHGGQQKHRATPGSLPPWQVHGHGVGVPSLGKQSQVLTAEWAPHLAGPR